MNGFNRKIEGKTFKKNLSVLFSLMLVTKFSGVPKEDVSDFILAWSLPLEKPFALGWVQDRYKRCSQHIV